MAGKNRKTTMAKLNRERGLAERRLAKQARKSARKLAAADEERAPTQPVADVADSQDKSSEA